MVLIINLIFKMSNWLFERIIRRLTGHVNDPSCRPSHIIEKWHEKNSTFNFLETVSVSAKPPAPVFRGTLSLLPLISPFSKCLLSNFLKNWLMFQLWMKQTKKKPPPKRTPYVGVMYQITLTTLSYLGFETVPVPAHRPSFCEQLPVEILLFTVWSVVCPE